MDEHGLPIVGTGVDYRKVPSLEHRNTLAMINKFVMHTTKFLNRFASVCEERLLDLSLRIQRLDISLNILEAKLNSIKGLESIQATSTYEPPEVLTGAGNAPTVQPTQAQQSSQPAAGPAPPPPPSGEPIPPPQPVPGEGDGGGASGGGGMKIKDHPDFQRYFKMKRLGVNPLQIAMEMRKNGLNPDLLEDEDAPAPTTSGGGHVTSGGGGGDNSSMSSGSSSDESTESEDDDDDSFSD